MHNNLATALKIAMIATVAISSLCSIDSMCSKKTPESIAQLLAAPTNYFESELSKLYKNLNNAYSQIFDVPPSAETRGRPLLMFDNVGQAQKARQTLITHFDYSVIERIPDMIEEYKLGDLLTKTAHKCVQIHKKLYSALYGYYSTIIDDQSYDETMEKGDIRAKAVRTSVLNVLKQALELSFQSSSQKKTTPPHSVLDYFMDLARESTPLRNPKLFAGLIVLDKEKQKKQQMAQQFLIEIIDNLQQVLQKTNTALINALSSLSTPQMPEKAPASAIKPTEPAPKPKQIEQPKQSPSPASSLPKIPVLPTPATQKEQELISLADSIETLKKDLFHLTEYINTGDLKQFDQYYDLMTHQRTHEKTMEQFEKLKRQEFSAEEARTRNLYIQYIFPVTPFLQNYEKTLQLLKQKAQNARELKTSLSNTNTRMRREAGLIGKRPLNKHLEFSYQHWLGSVRNNMNRAATIEREKYLVPIYEQFFAQVKQIEEAKPKK